MPRKTKNQLRNLAFKSILIASLVSALPLMLYYQFNRLGFINIAKGYPPVTVSGSNALITIYGMAIAAAFAWIMSAYYSVTSLMKILRKEYSEIDEAPEIVICNKCGEAQRSGELVEGHCRKCRGDVESIDGYYDRHAKKKIEPKSQDSKKIAPGSIGKNTCVRCGEVFEDENLKNIGGT